MPGPDLSRRSLVVGGGAGALGALGLTALATAPVAAAAELTAPAPTGAPAGSTRSVALDAARPASGGARLQSRSETSGGLHVVAVTVSGGSMIGVVFPEGTRAESVAVRVSRDGAPGAWTDLPLNDSEPDPNSRDAAGHVTGSDPLWVGELGSQALVEIQLSAADLGRARLEIVDPGAATVPTVRASVAASLFGLATADLGTTSDTGPEGGAGTEDSGTETDTEGTVTNASIKQPRIRSRAEWGADESIRKGTPGYSDTIKACVVHHTADGGTYSESQVPAVIRGMYRYHTVSLGWSDLGYNFVVDRFGGIWEGRAGGISRAVAGAHAGGFNKDTFGVSMMGDFTSVAPSAAMLESVAQVIAWKLSLYGLSANGTTTLTSAGGGTARYAAGTTVKLRVINAHRDVGFTACPGNVGFTKMDQIRARTAEILKSSGASTTQASPISAKYTSIGGAAAIGAAAGAEGAAKAGGRYRHFGIGSIYYTSSTGAHVVKGLIRDKFKSLGWENSFLGYPTTDEVGIRGGAFNHFQGGSIYFSPRNGAHVVRGLIRDKWASLGWEGSFLGFPTTDEIALRGGAFNHFTGGSIYFSPGNGAHVVRGAIRDRWAALGWEAGVLGWPTTDEIGLRGGAFNHFTKGSIYFSPANGAHAVLGAIRNAWAAQGWENGPLGYPTSDEYAVPGGRRSDFVGGTVTYDFQSGKTTVRGN
ncbi:N-acetylmuramoyl-L-alanine amidase [Kineococcus gynurae]|uniref:N-acetylmuramoyl-L-alanine amidase n=1 Tax=Kineococcus gynurae TaxID=452979 RepID=A0ABV5LRG0_9ACTN